MKKIIGLGLVFVGFLSLFCFFVHNESKNHTFAETKRAYLRIHIRANSNSKVDQDVKYKVKSAIVDYLTPIIARCKTLENAHCVLKHELSNIERVADKVLNVNGFNYYAKSRLCDEYFPARAYGDCVLDEGVYNALIVDLGSGTGNNWWCVIYPPLCFIGAEDTGSNNIVYKSKLIEIINKYCK